MLVVTPAWRTGLGATFHAGYRVLQIRYIILVYDISRVPTISFVSAPYTVGIGKM